MFILAFLFTFWNKTARGKKYLPMVYHLSGIQNWYLENKAQTGSFWCYGLTVHIDVIITYSGNSKRDYFIHKLDK